RRWRTRTRASSRSSSPGRETTTSSTRSPAPRLARRHDASLERPLLRTGTARPGRVARRARCPGDRPGRRRRGPVDREGCRFRTGPRRDRGFELELVFVCLLAEAAAFGAYGVVVRAALRWRVGPTTTFRLSVHVTLASLGAPRIVAAAAAG